MKRLFTEQYETYTKEAQIVASEIGPQIRKIIEKFCGEEGYSIIDIEHLLISEVTLNIAEFKILRNRKIKKDKEINGL